jgi:hypothetical protein
VYYISGSPNTLSAAIIPSTVNFNPYRLVDLLLSCRQCRTPYALRTLCTHCDTARKFCQLFLPMLLLGPLLGSFCEHTFTTFSGIAMFVSAALIDLWQRVLLLSLGRLISVALHHLITPGSFFLPRKPPVLPGVPAPWNFRQFESVAPV